VDYVTKWVEVEAYPYNDTQTMVEFFKKNIFCGFGIPRILISEGGTQFCIKALAKLLAKYNVKHKLAIPYHPQTSGQVEVSRIQDCSNSHYIMGDTPILIKFLQHLFSHFFN